MVACRSPASPGIKEWLPKWRRNGFRTGAGAPVKNAPLIRYLSALITARGEKGQLVEFEKVKGHSGDAGNDGADAQANLGALLPAEPERDWDALQRAVEERPRALAPAGLRKRHSGAADDERYDAAPESSPKKLKVGDAGASDVFQSSALHSHAAGAGSNTIPESVSLRRHPGVHSRPENPAASTSATEKRPTAAPRLERAPGHARIATVVEDDVDIEVGRLLLSPTVKYDMS